MLEKQWLGAFTASAVLIVSRLSTPRVPVSLERGHLCALEGLQLPLPPSGRAEQLGPRAAACRAWNIYSLILYRESFVAFGLHHGL